MTARDVPRPQTPPPPEAPPKPVASGLVDRHGKPLPPPADPPHRLRPVMDDLRLIHRGLRHDGGETYGECVWCGQPTRLRADTPFRPDLGSLPLHLTCGVWMRDAYRHWRDGQVLDSAEVEGIERLAWLPQLALSE
jgi:hypothetical protein